MLSGRAAELHPDVDSPRRFMPPVIVHNVRPMDGTGALAKFTRLGIDVDGDADENTGSFTATANRLTEAERRAAGLRRNGRPRRSRNTA